MASVLPVRWVVPARDHDDLEPRVVLGHPGTGSLYAEPLSSEEPNTLVAFPSSVVAMPL